MSFNRWRSLVDGAVVFDDTIRDSVVNRLPLDEGSGTDVSDSVGNADGTLVNGGDWTTDSRFFGGTAPYFDGASEYGEWQPRTQAPITWTFRCVLDSLDTVQYPFGHNNHPSLNYRSDDEIWRFFDGSGAFIDVTDPSSNVSESLRVLALRLDSNTQKLDVYDVGGNKVGDNSASDPSTSFDGATTYFGDREDGGLTIDGNVDLIDVHDVFLSDSELSDVIQSVYY